MSVPENEAANASEEAPVEAQSIVAVCYINKILGFACFQELLSRITADALPCGDEIDGLFTTIKASFNPTLFLVHPTIVSNKPLLDLLLTGLDGTPDFYRYKTVKSSAWSPESGLEALCTKLSIKSLLQSGGSAAHERENMLSNESTSSNAGSSRLAYLRLCAIINMESVNMKQSVAALVSYMQSNIFHLDEGKILVAEIRPFRTTAYMRLDAASFRSLQIFSEEQHPNVIKGTGRSKEGFSLFGLFDRTRSLPGRNRLREWMSKPFADADRIRSRQDGVELVVRLSNRDFISDAAKLLKRIHDIPRLLLRIKKVEASHIEWCRLYSTLQVALPLMDLMISFISSDTRDERDRQLLNDLFGNLDIHTVRSTFDKLQKAIDFDISMETSSICINSGYDAELDDLRSVYDNLEAHLNLAAHKVLDAVPLLQNVSVEYVPQIGYLVAVPNQDTHLLKPYESRPSTAHNLVASVAASAVGHRQLQHQQQQQHQQQAQDMRGTAMETGEEQEGDRIDHDSDDYDRPSPWGSLLPPPQSRSGDFFSLQQEDPATMSRGRERGSEGEEEEKEEEDDSFLFIYKQDDMSYYKNKIVSDLDDTLGDVQSAISDRQRALLLQVEDELLDSEATLQQLSGTLSSLDAIISLGTIASEMDFVRPEITDDSCIVIKNGRHLLQELSVDVFVPNDTFITGDKNVALITGPNSSGKSVYIKQVGLLVYLAHIGSWLPCEKARIGLTDRIMTRISSLETVASSQSSFALDLGQVARMLNTSTSKSLCLIDEFGKGTTPVDGIALLAATVKHFAKNPAKVFFVLHFTEILHQGILDGDTMRRVACYCMEAHQTNNRMRSNSDLSDGDSDPGNATIVRSTRNPTFYTDEERRGGISSTVAASERSNTGASASHYPIGNEVEGPLLLPLFKLKQGVAASSEGFPCARAAGVSEDVVARAEQLKQALTSRQPIYPLASPITHALQDSKSRALLKLFLSTTSQDWLSAPTDINPAVPTGPLGINSPNTTTAGSRNMGSTSISSSGIDILQQFKIALT